MSHTMKYIAVILGMLIMLGAGYLLSDYISNMREKKVQASSEIMLERVKKVSKLVSVEGYFSEMYNYKDFYNFDWSIFRKKALIRVKAKVSVGVDLQKAKFELDSKSKLLTISDIPAPEIISIDHDIDYYDITEGTFNSFTAQDFNKLNENAKEHIRSMALKSDLMQQSRRQTNEVINTFKLFAETGGWQVRVDTLAFKN